MNLLDFATTPMWRVWDEVARLAAEDGVGLAESELIGLAPLAAFARRRGPRRRRPAGATIGGALRRGRRYPAARRRPR